ncbi:MAG: motif domain protein [Planctomycetaceae bacterium]|nr:motif domain protein [Planctomycetaceae bacterium]
MAVESYDPCPCGSDKKFKFCCQPIAEELAAIERLAADHQPKQVLLATEKLESQHRTNRIVLRNNFRAHMALGQIEEARRVVDDYLSAHPDDAIANYFDIKWSLYFSGWEGTRPLMEQNLLKMRAQQPKLARELLLDVFQMLMQANLFMAARRYLLDGLMWSTSQEEFDAALSVFRKLNSAADIPFPFRCNYDLQTLPENQPNRNEFEEAWGFAEARNWTTAAQRFEALAEKDPHQPVLSRNAGLCYAWSGDLVASSELLGQAADDLPDFEAAVGLETLAQLLEMELPDQQVPLRFMRYRITGISKLLTKLTDCPRLIRQEVPEQVQEQTVRVSGLFALLSQDVPTEGQADAKHLPRILGQILVLDENQPQSEPAELQINARSPEFSDADRDFVLQLAEGLVDLTPAENWGEVKSASSISKDRAAVNFECVYGQGLKQSELFKLRIAFASHVAYEVWPQTSLSALDGVTPQKAARNQDAHLPVCAAINVMSTFAEEVGFPVDVDALRKQLGLPAVQPCTVTDPKEIASLPVTDVVRLPFAELSADALINAFPMVGSSNQTHAFRRMIQVMYDRKIFPPELSLTKFCQIAHAQAAKVLDLDDAMLWIQRGRAAIPNDKERFQWQIQWDFDEMFHSAMSGNINRLTEMLRVFAREYFPRIAELKDQVWALLEAERIDSREIMSIMNGTDFSLVGAASGAAASGGLWTPDSAEAAPGGGKLWVPGQE